jgi:hypothetical protein
LETLRLEKVAVAIEARPFDTPSDCRGAAAMPARMFIEFWDTAPRVVRLLIFQENQGMPLIYLTCSCWKTMLLFLSQKASQKSKATKTRTKNQVHNVLLDTKVRPNLNCEEKKQRETENQRLL